MKFKTLILTLFFSHILIAQQIPEIKSDTKESPIYLQDLNVDVTINGNVGITTLTMTFFNPNNSVLEGELNFPLLENQNVIGYALDINGKMRDAVAVEKNKARKVFEAIERRGIDPGFIEKTEGNNYRTRIYPFNAKSHRTVSITYQEQLSGEKNDQYLYTLPLLYKKKLKTFNLKVTAFTDRKPIILENLNSSLSNFSTWGNAYVFNATKKDFTLNSNLSLAIPKQVKQHISLYTENGESYFSASVFPKKTKVLPKTIPSKIALYWDNSYSMNSIDIDKFIELADCYLTKNANVSIELFTFNWTLSKSLGVFKKTSDLKNALQKINYDGASRIRNLTFEKRNIDAYWLVSDGLNNLTSNKTIKSKKDINTFSISNANNFQFLKEIALNNNGQFFNLNSTEGDKVYTSLTNRSLTLKNIETKLSKNDFYTPTKTVVSNQPFIITGKVNDLKDGKITLTFGYGNKITEKTIINLNKNTSKNKWIKQLWAATKINALMSNPNENKALIIDLAKKHSLVTKYTSLLVLEDIMDYVSNDITPPKELQNEYYKLLENKETAAKTSQKELLNRVWNSYQDRIKWWEKDFIAERKKTKKEKITINNLSNAPVLEVSDDELEEVVLSEISTEAKTISDDNEKSSAKPSKIKVNLTTNSLPEYLNQYKEYPSFRTYDSLRTAFNNKPVFFMDIANYHFNKNEKERAFQVLSNLAEIQLEDYILMRILAHQYQQWEQYNIAEILFKKVIELRDDEPQSFRDLALLYNEKEEHQKAIELLWKVVTTEWDSRFYAINDLALFELNNIASKNRKKVDLSFMNTKYYKPLPVDVRVVLNWSFPDTDLDLWVTNPFKEKTYYSNKLSSDGGRISHDFTQGYGPEEYLIKKGSKGDYKIDVDLYASRLQKIYGTTVLQIEIYTYYGTSKEKKQAITLQIKDEKDVVNAGSFSF